MANSINMRDIGQVSVDNFQLPTFNVDERAQQQGRFLITEGDLDLSAGVLNVNMTDQSGEFLKLMAQRGLDIDQTNQPIANMGVMLFDASGTDPAQLTDVLFLAGLGGDDTTGGATQREHKAIYMLDENFEWGLRFEKGLTAQLFWDPAQFNPGRIAINYQWKSSPPTFVF